MVKEYVHNETGRTVRALRWHSDRIRVGSVLSNLNVLPKDTNAHTLRSKETGKSFTWKEDDVLLLIGNKVYSLLRVDLFDARYKLKDRSP